MRRLNLAGIAIFLVSLTSVAAAADVEAENIDAEEATEISRAYIVARFAAAFNNNSEFPMKFTSYSTDILTEYKDNSVVGAVAAGYRFEDSFSLELEAGKTAFQVKSHTLLSVPTANSTVTSRFEGANAAGSVQATYGMFNIVSEQDFGTFVRPYMSAGLGLAQVEVKNFSINLPAPIDPLKAGDAVLINDKDMSYAWQIGVGAIVDISKQLSIEAGYRYFRVEDIDLKTSTSNDAAFNLSQHQALLGLRVNF